MITCRRYKLCDSRILHSDDVLLYSFSTKTIYLLLKQVADILKINVFNDLMYILLICVDVLYLQSI